MSIRYADDVGHGAKAPLASGAPPWAPRPRPRYELQGGAMDSLQVPYSQRTRPRSVPPFAAAGAPARRRRDSSASSSSSTSSRGRSRSSPKPHLQRAFTPSASGLGAGLLGAFVGGVAARELSDAAARRRRRGPSRLDDHDSADAHKSRLVTTLVGAVVGGLGANALEKKIEDIRDKRREEHFVEGQQKWGRQGRDDGGHGGSDLDPGRRRRRRGTAADYYDVYHGYDYVYDKKIPRRRSHDGLRIKG